MEVARYVEDARARLEVEGFPVPRTLLRDLFVAGAVDAIALVISRQESPRWNAWLEEIRHWRMVSRVRRLDPVPLARAISLRAMVETDTGGGRAGSELRHVIAAWMKAQWKAGRTLREAIGNAAWHDAAHGGSAGGLDMVYGELADVGGKEPPLPQPRLTGTEDGGLSQRWVRSTAGVFEERSAGRMPDDPGRLAPIEHAYRFLHPDLFLERVANAKLMQGYGAKEVTSRLRVSLDVWVDLVESEEAHRLPSGVRSRGVDVFRAVTCDLLRDLATSCDPRFVSTRVSLRRWLPGSSAQSDGMEFELSDLRGEMSSREDVPRVLAAAGCTVLHDRPSSVGRRRERSVPRARRADALARVLLGPPPAVVERPWVVGGRQQVVGIQLLQLESGSKEQEFELRHGTSLDMQDGAAIWRGRPDGRTLSRRILEPVLGTISPVRSSAAQQDLLGGLA